jgi:hypothetical protein
LRLSRAPGAVVAVTIVPPGGRRYVMHQHASAAVLIRLICGGDREAPRPRTLRLDHPRISSIMWPEGRR